MTRLVKFLDHYVMSNVIKYNQRNYELLGAILKESHPCASGPYPVLSA
jgi:hypothetical protein